MGPLPVCLPIMLLLLLPSLLLLLLRPGPGSGEDSRTLRVHRRGILELAGTVGCVGPRTPIAYMKYGCFCGLGGHGQPRDAIDWCCHGHDCCYTRAEEAGCSPKTERYSWQCVNQSVLCGPAENKCQELLCKCDQEIANCLAQTEYNLKYLFYPQFLCEPDSPKCD
ncbi:group 10 secretory phospholipase A2 [Gorilla gorilla gorilla]|nr:group 10 secretory phospholipase A2 [Gorilla gorilla gorilla]XP_055221806.1 group 10 secretory phospholipase A2 [Gorilla gorilla gorilla]XP_055221807.1 group 10 secretory phospholipase A2 [Gorilla gorilla gorilla]